MTGVDDIRLVATIIGFAIGIWRRKLESTPEALVQWATAQVAPSTLDSVGLDRAARYVNLVTRVVPRSSSGPCVPRSLILHRFAKHLGLATKLHWGVRRDAGRVVGHMWMTLDGIPYRERTDIAECYSELLVWPAPEVR